MKTKPSHATFLYSISAVFIAVAMFMLTTLAIDTNEETNLSVSDSKTNSKQTSASSLTYRITEINAGITFTELPDCHIIPFENILQTPELPTGCEITSLAQVLNYYGYDVDKLTLADIYLDKAIIGAADLNTAFISDPRHKLSYGCNAPVIVKAAHKYLTDIGGTHTAINITNCLPDDLYYLIDNDIPVIVWSTMGLVEPVETHMATLKDGTSIKFMENEHCSVLIGYDMKNKTVTLSDPLYNIVTYPMDKFELRFRQMGNQAIYLDKYF